MENNKYQPILDAYQLVEGALIKGKEQDEIFKIGEYDADKRAYTAHPFDNGQTFDDFSVLITESELMDNYLIETDPEEDDDDELLSDSL